MSCPMHDRNCTALCTCDELALVKRENARLTAELKVLTARLNAAEEVVKSPRTKKMVRQIEEMRAEIGLERTLDNRRLITQIGELQAEIARLIAELARFVECDESDMERMTEAEWHCTRKIYHKEGE